MNDIVDNLQNDVRLFADDTSLFVIVDNAYKQACANSMSSDLDNKHDWVICGRSHLIPRKPKLLLFQGKEMLCIHQYIFLAYQSRKLIFTCILVLHFNQMLHGIHTLIIFIKACSRLIIFRMLKHSTNRSLFRQCS